MKSAIAWSEIHALLDVISEGHTPGIEFHLHCRPSRTTLCSFTIVKVFTPWTVQQFDQIEKTGSMLTCSL
jgi:hypothetical protein